MNIRKDTALTFDDVLLVPKRSRVKSRFAVNTRAPFYATRKASKVMADDGIRAWLQSSGAQARTSTPSELSAILQKEMTQWQDVITQYGIKAE